MKNEDLIVAITSAPRRFLRKYIGPIFKSGTYATKLAKAEKLIAKQQITINKLQETLLASETPEHCLKKFAAFSFGHTIARPKFVAHGQWLDYLSNRFNKPGLRILEIGSRNVTGGATRTPFAAAEYIGFDYYAGENVDVVGDAHRLSSYFKADDKFDLIFSSAVFEHLYAPWLVAQEIQKLLKIGGHVFIETHFSYISHERPWNFFQFSDMGLRALFNNALGFKVIDCGMSNPMNGIFSDLADKYLIGLAVGELYCHSEIFCEKVADAMDFDWKLIDIDDIVENTRYPAPVARP